MKITAIMLVWNNENILATSVGHLLNNLRVNQVIIADNGSTDQTRSIAQRMAGDDERIAWTDVAGLYLQSEITTGLAREACLRGSDWILPNDADEFFSFGSHNLRDLCASKYAGAYVLSVRNFVQWSWVLQDHPRSTETMVFSVDPLDPRQTARTRVEAKQIAFLQAPALPKQLLRATPSITIHMGNHSADGIDGESVSLPDAEVLHAPMRSRQSVLDRVEQGRRVAALGLPENYGWHLRRLMKLAPHELFEEWRINSTRFGLIGPRGHKKRLRFDLRLRRISKALGAAAS